ncbi:MAG: IS1634 family transposase [bacterium]
MLILVLTILFPQWIRKTAVSEILGICLDKLNDDKIYYELDKIEENKNHLEDHLFRMTYRKDPSSYTIVNYDLSSSYFVGFKCKLSAFGRSKDDKHGNKQVIVGLLVNDKGYPFSWDVYPGNTAEVHTLTDKVDICRKRFKMKDITLVFDRGIVSDDNLEYITDKKLKYISCLDKDQIQNVPGIDLSIFKVLTTKDLSEKQLSILGLDKYDQDLWFKDLGEKENRRYIRGLNPTLFKEERESRIEKLRCFEEFVEKKNVELKSAKRSRGYEATKNCIINELKRLKTKKYFNDEPVLEEIEIQPIDKDGKKGSLIKSYQVSIERNEVNIDKDELVEGLCVFVSNHIQKKEEDVIFSSERIIKAYRDKTKIEDAFKHIKSFLKIRPFFVNTDKHVRAVYTVSVVSYFINKDLAERRKQIEGIDYLNSKNLYEPFRGYDWIKLKDTLSGKTKGEEVWLSEEQKRLLNNLNINIQ